MGYLLVAAIALMTRNRVHGSWSDAETTARGDSTLLPMSARTLFAWALRPVMLLVRWAALPADVITTLAVLLAFMAGVAAASGRFPVAGWLYLGSGVCDVIDGRIARQSGTAGPRGAVIDSVSDRYGDAAVLTGLAWHYRHGWQLLVCLAALVGSLLVSYVRARGEGLGVDVRVGLFQRPERVVLLGATLVLAPVVRLASGVSADAVVLAMLALTAVMTHATTFQRVFHVLSSVRPPGDPERSPGSRWRRLLPAVVSSAVATVADFAVMTLLVAGLGVGVARATAVGCVVGGVVNFSVNRVWTFSSADARVPQMVRYAIVSGTSALLNSGGVALVLMLPFAGYQLAWLLVRALVFSCWNFPLQRDYVYGGGDEHGEPRLAERDHPSSGSLG